MVCLAVLLLMSHWDWEDGSSWSGSETVHAPGTTPLILKKLPAPQILRKNTSKYEQLPVWFGKLWKRVPTRHGWGLVTALAASLINAYRFRDKLPGSLPGCAVIRSTLTHWNILQWWFFSRAVLRYSLFNMVGVLQDWFFFSLRNVISEWVTSLFCNHGSHWQR